MKGPAEASENPDPASSDNAKEYDNLVRFDRLILVAIVGVPLLLLALQLGWFPRVASFSAPFFRYLPEFINSVIFSMAVIWIAIGHTPRGKHIFRQAAPRFAVASLWVISNAAITSDLNHIAFAIIQSILWIVAVLGLLVIMGRWSGVCMINRASADIPVRRPLSIADIMIVTAAIAIMMACAGQLIAYFPDVVGATNSNSIVYGALFLLFGSVVYTMTVIVLLVFRTTSKWKLIPCVFFGNLLFAILNTLLIFLSVIPLMGGITQYGDTLFFLGLTNSLTEVFGVVAAIWCLQKLGMRIVTRAPAATIISE